MKSYLRALSFLTGLPVPFVTFSREGRELASAAACFPLVGATVGLVLACLAAALLRLLPPGPVVVLVIAFNFFLTRGLHADGLADTVDGLMGAHEREKALAVMADSAVGAMGAAALILVFLAKYAALLSMDPGLMPYALLLMPVYGRWAMVSTGVLGKPARSSGLGALFLSGLRWPRLLQASLAALFPAATAICLQPGLLYPALFGLTAAAAAGHGLAFYAARRLGGLTGDVLGAVNEVGETFFLLGVLLP